MEAATTTGDDCLLVLFRLFRMLVELFHYLDDNTSVMRILNKLLLFTVQIDNTKWYLLVERFIYFPILPP